MRQTLVYSIYTFLNIVKSKVFLICTPIYCILMAIILYLLPVILKIRYYEIYNNKMILISINVIIVILAISISLQLFKKNQLNGSELIILSKPISRVKISWTKIFVIIFVYLLISIVMLIISLFLLLVENPYYVIGMIIGSFFGPLTTMLFWGGISILFCLIIKNYATLFLIVFGIMGISTIVSTIVDMIIKNPNIILKDQNITNYELRLFDNDINKLGSYVICLYNNNIVNSETKINDSSLSDLNLQPNTILRNYYEEALKSTNVAISSYFDIWELLCGIFNVHFYNLWYPNYFDVDLSEYMMSRNTIFMYKPLDYQTTLNNKTSIFFNDKKYYLTLSNFDSYLNNYIESSDIILPSPIFDNNNFAEINFSNENIDRNLLFAQTYFNDDVLNKMNSVSTKLKQIYNNNNYSDGIGYFDLISTYLFTKLNASIMGINYNQNYKDMLNVYFYNFQKLTYEFLLDYLNNPTKYSFINSEHFTNILNGILMEQRNSNQSNFVNSSLINILCANANTYNSFLNNNLSNNALILNLSIQNNIPITILNEDKFDSLNTITFSSTYNYNILLPIILVLSILLNIIGASMIMQKDQY